ncbi:MAG TPA: DUF4386 domain-containing protein [Thermoanaerobaculia bacterium]|nr:DUF4386 domain-containing protein [Thermoanaerobaculia bacterium]
MKRLARIGGALYLVIIAIGLWGEMFVRGRLTTADAIRAHESLWRAHIAAELLLLICAIALLAILYILFRPVNRDLAVLAVFFNIVAIAIEANSTLSLIQAVLPSGSDVTTLALRTHANAFGVSLLFFGCFCIVIGILIYRSGFMAKTIGILMAIAGVCYLINSFALIAAPPLAHVLFPAILIPSFIGELSFALYLAIVGVR